MKIPALFFTVLIFLQGPASAAPSRRMDFYSKLDLPIYSAAMQARAQGKITPLYIGSDKSYAAESKEVRIIGRSLNVGLAVAALFQPLAPLLAAGFLLAAAYNATALFSAVASKPAPRSQWTFLGSTPCALTTTAAINGTCTIPR
ncbi:MAG: hypothetical protein A2270_05830 [Elusimicrobia bacterium RIFOXYA12_FULL_51_18]|nr:MAG: hypothetical protein A2270_05830 [Elusimicrobia bacterium RIFOXYA12_FULL_51_18]OGS29666.1 MAG: hypothetical protein A2218_03110 [Elusimicrobia bacterium RIFOXYA2_FULL_53_38]